MTLQEFGLRILYAVKPLLPWMLLIALLTAALAFMLAFLSRGFCFTMRGFAWLSLFYEMKGYQGVRLAAIWVKLCVLFIGLISFQKLTAQHYLLLILPGVLYAIDLSNLRQIAGNLLGTLMEIAGLLAANIVCSYIIELNPGLGFVVVYCMMSLFLGLYGLYLFLHEVNHLSLGRRTNLEE